MYMGNRSIMSNLSPTTRIYRIFSRRYFFELFRKNENALVLPQKWDDPFENVFLNSPAEIPGGDHVSFAFRNDVYGQCWTLSAASDAIWQIYSHNKNAIRLRTTVGKLIESLRAQNLGWADQCCFIGRVNYLSDKKLREFGETVFKAGISSSMIARSLLVKRRAYKHENEVRLIYIEPEDIEHAHGVYKYNIDALSIFDQVMVDGRVSSYEFNALKNRISKRTGFSTQQIKRSLLYEPPKGFVVRLP